MKAKRRNAWSLLLIVLANGLIKRGGEETELPSFILKLLMDWSSKTLIDALPWEELELFSGFAFRDIVAKPPPHLFAATLKITRVREREGIEGAVEIKRRDFIADESIWFGFLLLQTNYSSEPPRTPRFLLLRFRMDLRCPVYNWLFQGRSPV